MILLEMFTYPFIVRAFVVGILVSVCAALLGVPLVLKRYSMIGDGLSHVSFGALSIALACGWAPLPVSIPVVILAALGLLRMTEKSRMGADAVQRALNARLPPDIRIRKASRARPDFHARRSATAKEYRYFVWNDALVLPDKRLYAAHAYRPLDLAAMRDGARRFVGRHDFASFTANPQREVESTVRTIFAFAVVRRGKELVFRVSGEGFLYKQVRSMVGFLLRVGEGAEKPEAVSELLTSCAPRKARVPSAAPHGLFLWQVWYGRRHPGASAGSEE